MGLTPLPPPLLLPWIDGSVLAPSSGRRWAGVRCISGRWRQVWPAPGRLAGLGLFSPEEKSPRGATLTPHTPESRALGYIRSPHSHAKHFPQLKFLFVTLPSIHSILLSPSNPSYLNKPIMPHSNTYRPQSNKQAWRISVTKSESAIFHQTP